jgi:ribosomal protein S18 acetylase RimI-like enzyme
MDEILCRYQTRDGRDAVVRKYRPEDRPRVRWICSETGFVGRPQEKIFDGREEFADLWSAYWTDYEPYNAFVGAVGGRVEGYLLGCLDTPRQEKIWSERILPRVGRKMIRNGWFKNALNRQYVAAMLRSRLRGELAMPMNQILPDYPAHLHTNIGDPACRGIGLGKRMMLAYFDLLRQHSVPGVHLGTTDHNREAVPFYERMGFRVLYRNRATIYDHAIDDPPLHILLMGKKL